MERKEFLAWSSQVDRLSETQKLEIGEILASRPAGEASIAAVELSVGEDRTCPRCGTSGAKANGKSWVTTQVLRCQSIRFGSQIEKVSYVYQQLAGLWGVPTTNAQAVRPRHSKLLAQFSNCVLVLCSLMKS